MAMTITADMVLKLTVEYGDDDNCRHGFKTYRRVWTMTITADMVLKLTVEYGMAMTITADMVLKLTVEYGDDDNCRHGHGLKTYRRVWF